MITLDEQIKYMRGEVSYWIDRLPSAHEKCKAILSTLERVRDEETSTSKLYQDAFQKGMDAMERKTKAIRDATAEKLRDEGSLRIGKYAIKPFFHGGFWIEESSGEGMQTSKEKLEQMIHEFYLREF